MRIVISDPTVGMLASALAYRGFRARLVGGAVRDSLSGIEPKDMDLTTDAIPEVVVEVMERAGFRTVPTGLKHGTVTVVVDGRPYEVTTLRADIDTDGRHATVEYVTDFRQDAARRDFTINAMSADPTGEVHDYFGGLADLAARRVRFVGSARSRIEEDYLRILRFFRFRARFGGSDNSEELEAVAAARNGLKGISVERVWSEMSQIIVHARCSEELRAMRDTGVAGVIGLPVDDRLLEVATAVAAAGARPSTVLGVLGGDAERTMELVTNWKVSRAEADDAVVAARVMVEPSSDPMFWVGVASDGTDISRLIPVLEATGRSAAAAALRLSIPVFPLRGRDFVEAGLEPGPEVGMFMSVARDEWKASGFTAGRDALLSSALANANLRRP